MDFGTDLRGMLDVLQQHEHRAGTEIEQAMVRRDALTRARASVAAVLPLIQPAAAPVAPPAPLPLFDSPQPPPAPAAAPAPTATSTAPATPPAPTAKRPPRRVRNRRKPSASPAASPAATAKATPTPSATVSPPLKDDILLQAKEHPGQVLDTLANLVVKYRSEVGADALRRIKKRIREMVANAQLHKAPDGGITA